MAISGKGYFDSRGQFFKSPEEATTSDLASVLGRIGEAEGLASGIANILLQKREEIERIYAEHDNMIGASGSTHLGEIQLPSRGNVMPLRSGRF